MASESKNPEQQNPDTGAERKPADDQTSGPAPVLRTIVDVPDSIRQELRAYREEQRRDGKINRNLTIVAVLGAWALAVIATLQWHEAHDANRIARDANAATERAITDADRPWVSIDKIDLTDFAVGQKAGADLTLLNTGKTPAIDVRTDLYAQIAVAGTPTAPPSNPHIPGFHTKSVVFPNQQMHRPTFIDAALSTGDFNQINAGTKSLLTYGELTYTDRFRHPHHTTICAFYNPQISKAFIGCAEGNTAD